MSIATTSSGGNAGSVVAELALEDLERCIGRRTNDRRERPVRECEVVAHLNTVLTRKSLRWSTLTGRETSLCGKKKKKKRLL
jgi:hypothetical protein